jgi:chromosome segregation ATPase
MAIIKHKDIFDDSKKVFENLMKDLEKLNTEVAKLTTTNKKLSTSLQKVKKTSDGAEAKELTRLTKQLESSTEKLNKTTSEQARKLLDVKVEQQRLNKIEKDAAVLRNKKISEYQREGIRLKELRNEYKKLAFQNKENTKEGKKLLANIQELDKKFKDVDDAVGQNQRSVGKYSDALKNAMPGVSGMIDGFFGMAKAAMAFIMTPIGAAIAAIVGAFKLLQSAFNRSLSSQEKLNKVTGKLGVAFNVLLDFLTPLVDFLIDGLLEALNGAGKAMEWIIDKMEDLGVISEETTKKIKKTFDASAKSADNLATSERQLVESQIALEKAQLSYQNQAEKLRQIRDDESLAIEDRIKANEELGVVLSKQNAFERSVALQRLKLAKDRQKVNGESIESIQEIGDAEIKLLEIEERITGQRSEQLVNVNSLLKEQQEIQAALMAERVADMDGVVKIESTFNQERKNAANDFAEFEKALQEKRTADTLAELEKRKNDEIEKAQEVADAKKAISEKAESELMNLSKAIANSLIDDKLNKTKDATKAEEEILKNKLDKGLISEQQYNEQIAILNKKQRIADATAEKKKALFGIGIETLLAVAKAGFITPAAIAIAIQGAISAAVIAATPIPKFAQGTEYVQGAGTTKSDSIHAMLSKGERVVPAEINQMLNGIPNAELPKLVSDAKNNNMLSSLLATNNQKQDKLIYLMSNLGYVYEDDGKLIKQLSTGKTIIKRKNV